ncbi:uncharacterized protein LOC127852311 isoform X1 [Dreissena polymorpha]|uniref:uncharacterized protein LOC127852311 isoform X1 n=1 Tax=Dreissena polymorpha TaxID=45954 RepID=UPI002264F299|nr:uncharacterized protein LOC127852311 isoform X1 [Dreissena polymorpha]
MTKCSCLNNVVNIFSVVRQGSGHVWELFTSSVLQRVFEHRQLKYGSGWKEINNHLFSDLGPQETFPPYHPHWCASRASRDRASCYCYLAATWRFVTSVHGPPRHVRDVPGQSCASFERLYFDRCFIAPDKETINVYALP